MVLQRRCLRAARDIKAGEILTREMIDVLRPAPMDAIMPYELERVVGTQCTGGHSCRQRAALDDVRITILRVLYFTRDYTPHDHRFPGCIGEDQP